MPEAAQQWDNESTDETGGSEVLNPNTPEPISKLATKAHKDLNAISYYFAISSLFAVKRSLPRPLVALLLIPSAFCNRLPNPESPSKGGRLAQFLRWLKAEAV